MRCVFDSRWTKGTLTRVPNLFFREEYDMILLQRM